MEIKFKGNDCPLKSFQFGVIGDNKSSQIEFVLETIQEHVDLSTLKGYVKSSTSTLSFVDKEPLSFSLHDGRYIKGVWKLLRKHTSNKTINVQLQFENDSDDVVWQTTIITFHFAKTINADKEIENKYPGILQNHEARISALEGIDHELVLEYSTYLAFPTIGKTQTIYLDKQQNKAYRYDSEDLKYYCIGSDYDQITIINGGKL